VNRTRLMKLLPYAAVPGLLLVSIAFVTLIVFEHPFLELRSWAVGFAEAHWRRAFGNGGRIVIFTVALLILELIFLDWKKTTIYLAFVQRGKSALSDLGFTIYYLSPLKRFGEYLFTFGGAYLVAKFVDRAGDHIGWFRLELPNEGVLGITAGFAVFFLITSFIAYWQHRLLHTRWFWQLHRFHHAAPDLNIFTGFRDNPAAALLNVPLALQSLLILKMPDASLFAAFFLTNQVIATLQHSQLPWSLGWVGRWVIASPQNHQFHHSIDEEHRDRNFSNCPMWDHLFGTWYGGPNAPSGFGIPDQAHIERPLSQWLIDVWIFYRDSARALAGLLRSIPSLMARTPSASQISEVPVSIPSE
jgi:sterol desaturase/sphingolipid hydroxylase (fatty acid hydroxylase superfamily)